MSEIQRFYGPNAGYVLELYEQYVQDPSSVDPATRAYFEHWTPESLNGHARPAAAVAQGVDVAKVVGVANLAQSIRAHGHHAARLDPLDGEPLGDPLLDPHSHGLSQTDLASLPASIIGGPAASRAANAAEAVAALRAIYCGTIGYDFDHVQDAEERQWLLDAVENDRFNTPLTPEAKRTLLKRLTDVDAFERFLHRAFVGQKRFSIEGTDMMVPMLDEIIGSAAAAGTCEIVIGAAHRGRLNMMTHLLGKPYEKTIAQFLHLDHPEPAAASEAGTGGWTGDVKYHMGARREAGGEISARITLAANPSHLEFVNPVSEGMARASQEDRSQRGEPRQNVDACLPITIHGDSAFPGEGVVAETLNLSLLPGYQTGGTIHIISNNQIGFTTRPSDARSTFYASDMARGFEIPVIHVNADDPAACLVAARIAYAYRERFHKDFLVDLIGYRRWGHNEGDEPAFTQPLLYAQISKHPTVREIWARTLDQEGVLPLAEAEAMATAAISHLQELRAKVASGEAAAPVDRQEPTPGQVRSADTAVPMERLEELNQQIHDLPEGFSLNPKLRRNMERRRELVAENGALDWAHAETLAFASILADGTPVRLTGQDTQRGTFSQRHLVFHDPNTGATATPLQTMPLARASFAVYNSPLSEAAPIGYEYGYSVQAPEALVVWEGQFGDFANAGQVMIDQFIVAARQKWEETPSLVLLLPHGYEGQGPEHSSGRLERYLQLAADDNIRVANCTTSAQYFHLLRRQAALLDSAPRPLVVMTPKSLLRHPRASSPASELANGRFSPVLDDPDASQRAETISRVVLCSGKVYVDLVGSDLREAAEDVAIVRLELLYPFPEEDLRQVLGGYANAREIIWLQEEPKNMGAWSFVNPRLQAIVREDQDLRYIGRPERASPAEGLAEAHTAEQNRIVSEALQGAPVLKNIYGVKQHAD
jgi:2-oxoglutarate dehydrogenase E1 component